MLAQDNEDEIKKWSHIICEEKYDGVRVIAFVSGNEVKFYTRAFNEIPNQYLEKIGNECLALIKNSGFGSALIFLYLLLKYLIAPFIIILSPNSNIGIINNFFSLLLINLLFNKFINLFSYLFEILFLVL